MPDFASILPVKSPMSNVRPSASSRGPTYADVMAKLNAPIGIDSNVQNILNTLKSQYDFGANKGMSEAQALAVRRGIGGSSIEQFGTQAANEGALRAYGEAANPVLLQNLTLGNQRNIAGAQLTSDEVASMRNMAYQKQALALQQSLGQQGIDVANANIGASRDIANQSGRYSLYGSLAQSVLPGLLYGGGGGMGGGGGIMGSLFGGGAAGAGGGYGAPLGAGMIGPAGPSGIYGMGAGLGTFAGAHPGMALAGAGLGAMALSNWGQRVGGTGGGILANPIGYQLNAAKSILSKGGNVVSNVGHSIGSAVTSVFPF